MLTWLPTLVLMHLLVRGAFCPSRVEAGGNAFVVLMHLLVLGAFWLGILSGRSSVMTS